MIGAMRHPIPRPAVAIAALALFIAAWAQPAAAKSYFAERFDSVVRVLPDGSLDVTETVVFRFTDGTFRQVFREVPARLTDGVNIVRAEMDGAVMPFGSELGTVEVRRRDGRVRVLWRFRPVEQATRTFTLHYLVKGVVRQEAGADLLAWHTTPFEHDYSIASSTVRFELPVQPQAAPRVTSRRSGTPQVSATGAIVEITTPDIGSNGWAEAELEFPARSVASVAPRWQQRDAAIARTAPTWVMAAGLVLAAGLILLIAWRFGYEAPPPVTIPAGAGFQQPPDDASPALSGVLAANGRPALEHAMAAVFSLAERGVLEIEEEPRGMLGTRNFEVTRRNAGRSLQPHEQQILEAMFSDRSGSTQKVTLTQARTRLTRRWRQISKAFAGELAAAGLFDDTRRALRRRYMMTAAGCFVLAVLAVVPAGAGVQRFGPWPLLIPAAIMMIALTALITGTTVTMLSNEGVRRARGWRDYRKHLRLVATGKQPAIGVSVAGALPYAVALGLASAWSKFMKTQPHLAPAWFRALPGASADPAAFVAFVAHGGAGASSGAHGGAAGAAGGGASGAS
jgi:hypothetical protein